MNDRIPPRLHAGFSSGGDVRRSPGLARASRLLLVFAAVLLLATACATQQDRPVPREALAERMPALNLARFEPEREGPAFEDLVALTPAQEAEFLRFFNSGLNANHEPHRRVYAYLTQRLGDTDFQHLTQPASETIESRSGNCMSLALVTTAYARLADVEIGWQLADSDPVYSSEGSVIYSAEHIQTRLYRRSLSLDTHSVFLGPSYLLVDYYTDDVPRAGRLLQKSEMIALVYQNLGIEAMAEDRLEDSFWLLRAALQHDPANPDLYNAMAVLHRRAGDTVTAENLYRFSLDEFGDRLIILRNYRRLLVAQERSEEARDRAWTASDQGRYREKLAARGER
ncbi:MAG: tetratricopeptide repeat protein [Wenzhouxiangellaceae bacterium]